MTVGELIKGKRMAYGLSQEELGERLGVRKREIEKWERGHIEDIPLTKIRTMAELFKINPSRLIEDEVVDSCNLYDDSGKALQ